MKIAFEVTTDPLPQPRPRFTGRHCYQPARNVEYRKRVKEAAVEAMGDLSPLTCEVIARVKVYRKYKPTARIYGDVDNHLKAIFDGLNGIVFADDSQIVRCEVEKFKDKESPRAVIEIEAFQ